MSDMISVELFVVLFIYTIISVVCIAMAVVEKSFPFYTKNGSSFKNFSIFEFLAFIPLIPIAIFIIPLLNGGIISKIVRYRPFFRYKFQIGDYVIINNKQYLVLDVTVENGEERIQIKGDFSADWVGAATVIKVSPLEKAMK